MTYIVSTQAQIRQLETRNVVRKYNQEPTIYKQFAAAKISDKTKRNTVVEYTDVFGQLHRIPVRSARSMRKAQEFFSILKKETAEINAILREYPVSYGKIAKGFVSECKQELKAYGLNDAIITRIVGC